jgi:DNA-binding beta-propeller fold protein YncE
MSDIKDARPVVGRLLRGAVILVTLTPSLWAQQERPTTWGRRLSAGPAGLLLLTDPDIPPRVVLYDVTGDAPRKVVGFGEQGWSPGQLETPHGAALNWDNELLVTNTNNHRVDVFDMTSLRKGQYPRLLRTFGSIGKAPGRFQTPLWPVAISPRKDLQDQVFVSDGGNDRVEVFDRAGKLVRVIGGHGSEDGKLDRPMAIAFDPSGNVLYVAENGNRRISAFAAVSGRYVGKIGEPGPSGGGLAIPHGLAVGPDGVVYVTDLGPRQVRRFKPRFDSRGALTEAKELPAWGKPGTGPGELLKPYSIAVDVNNRVYVADFENDHCQVFSAEGAYLAAFGDDAEPLTPLSPPSGLSAKLPESVCSNAGSYRLRVKPSRNPVASNQMMGLEAEVLEGCGDDAKPAEGVRLLVSAGMPEHQHGMTTQARVMPLGPGRWDVGGLLFHMPGYWELRFDVARDTVVERAQLEFLLE